MFINNIKTGFPTAVTAITILLTLPGTVAFGERPFFKLKFKKTIVYKFMITYFSLLIFIQHLFYSVRFA